MSEFARGHPKLATVFTIGLGVGTSAAIVTAISTGFAVASGWPADRAVELGLGAGAIGGTLTGITVLIGHLASDRLDR
jgi:hypothetical protein